MNQPTFPQQTSGNVNMQEAFGILKEMSNGTYEFTEKVTPQGKIAVFHLSGEYTTDELEAALILMLMYQPTAVRLANHPMLAAHCGDFDKDPVFKRVGVSHGQATEFLIEYAKTKGLDHHDWCTGYSASKCGRAWIDNIKEPVVLEAILACLYGFCFFQKYTPMHCEEVV